MERIIRPLISEIDELKANENLLIQYCNECEVGNRSWTSSGRIYKLIRSELKKLTLGHCSFCDGYPLAVTSKETIEHYYPKEGLQDYDLSVG